MAAAGTHERFDVGDGIDAGGFQNRHVLEVEHQMVAGTGARREVSAISTLAPWVSSGPMRRIPMRPCKPV